MSRDDDEYEFGPRWGVLVWSGIVAIMIAAAPELVKTWRHERQERREREREQIRELATLRGFIAAHENGAEEEES